MTGIVGIERASARSEVEQMLNWIGHRGPSGSAIIETDIATLGMVFDATDTRASKNLRELGVARDGEGYTRLAEADARGAYVTLTRDALGVAPLYHGRLSDGALCFASEVKALAPSAVSIEELPPGSIFDGQEVRAYYEPAQQPAMQASPERIAAELRRRLAESVERHVDGRDMGAWLSGGLDSSALAALARPHVGHFHTFAAGLAGAPDLAFADEVAEFIGSDHHKVIVTFDDLLAALPEVIFHLESFDARLVRSCSPTTWSRAWQPTTCPTCSRAKGATSCLPAMPISRTSRRTLPDELVDIIGRLHNTALQRVDRCASAHGTTAHVAFLDPQVVQLALSIPVELKLHDGVEKWILRRALDGSLPDSVLDRTKAKFWEGAGVGELLAQYADEQISDADFAAERSLPNGWTLNSKEELLYYRIFRERFGDSLDLAWMGRTKDAPLD